MQFVIPDPDKTLNLINSMRQAGYHFDGQRGEEAVFYRSLSSSLFPRFHIYAKRVPPAGGWELNLHLDQKQPSYEEGKAHAGEYDGELVEKEAKMIQKAILKPSPQFNIEID